MDEIANNVYIEDQFLGVTLGVISQPRGLIQIDAPPSPEDGRSWRAAMAFASTIPPSVRSAPSSCASSAIASASASTSRS